MSQQFEPGDFLLFQLEAGYGLIRLLGIDANGSGDQTWHLAAYEDLFMDPDSAEGAIEQHESLTVSKPHLALTTRAFLSTQVAKMQNRPLTQDEDDRIKKWKGDPSNKPSDKSVRLLLGLR